MMVYGDRVRAVDPRARLDELARLLAGSRSLRGVDRAELFTAALIAAGELAQGVSDAVFEALGRDCETPEQLACTRLTLELARLAQGPEEDLGGAGAALQALLALDLPDEVACRTPEGYAFYAVYPEAYAAAARRCAWAAPPAVIGLRSIGASLGPAVAVAAGSDTVVTLRPCGPPFERRLHVSGELRRRLTQPDRPVAIVDEGPGLSGSSFAAAIDFARSLGARDVVAMPSHPGAPGAAAGERQLALWKSARQAPASFEALAAEQPIEGWFDDLIGPALGVEDLSGGAWCETRQPRPPTWAAQERRKFRIRTRSGPVLAKFAGLGRTGGEKLARAQALFAAGFTVEPIGLRRGFLVERWSAGAPLDASRFDRTSFLVHVSDYLGFRARALPANGGDGASLAELSNMAAVNGEELGGKSLRTRIERRLGRLCFSVSTLRPIAVDGRLQPWEWLVLPGDRFLKTDALDHACSHDLVGCQDVAWDVAGAAIEYGATEEELTDLVAGVRKRSDAALEPAAVEAFMIYYAGFQLGYWTLAAEAAPPGDKAAIAARLRFCRVALERSL